MLENKDGQPCPIHAGATGILVHATCSTGDATEAISHLKGSSLPIAKSRSVNLLILFYAL